MALGKDVSADKVLSCSSISMCVWGGGAGSECQMLVDCHVNTGHAENTSWSDTLV